MIMETTNVASVTTWLLPCILVVATQALPLRIETTIIGTLRKLVVRTYHTIYFATQCFNLGKDPRILNMCEEISIVKDQPILENGESSSFQSAHDKSIEDPTWEWEVYDSIYYKDTMDRKLVKRTRSQQSRVDEETSNQASQPFAVIYENIKDLPWASQIKVCVYSSFLMKIINDLIPRKVDQSARGKKEVLLNRPELFRIQGLRNEHTSIFDQKTSKPSSSEGTSNNREELWHLRHLLRFMDNDFNEIKHMYAAMNSSDHKVSWEMLWAFFPPGERVVYHDNVTEEMLCDDVLKTKYKKSNNQKPLFVIKVTKWDYDCRSWKQYSRKQFIPDYLSLGSARPPHDVIRNNDVTTLDISHRDDRMFAPAVVYGFSFRLKKWGSFCVSGFSHINYNRSAYDDLVMDEDTKDVMEKIVRKQLEDGKDTTLLGKERLDSIAGKGEGTIFLCYGPPGTGKTLTAESF